MIRKRDLRRFSSWLLLGIWICLGVAAKGSEMTYPKPSLDRYVNDYAGIIDEDSTKKIVALGRELEKMTTAQAVVVTIESLEGMPITDYANGLFRAWGIGQKGKDNGLLILVANKEKQWRVEVGRGLEGAITDAGSSRIMINLAVPQFIEGKYGIGLASSYSELCDQIAKEYHVELTHLVHSNLPSTDSALMLQNSQRGLNYYWILIGLIVIDLIFNRGRFLRLLLISSFFSNRGNHRGGGNGFGGGGFGGGNSNGGGSSGSW